MSTATYCDGRIAPVITWHVGKWRARHSHDFSRRRQSKNCHTRLSWIKPSAQNLIPVVTGITERVTVF